MGLFLPIGCQLLFRRFCLLTYKSNQYSVGPEYTCATWVVRLRRANYNIHLYFMFKLNSSNIACHPLKEVVWILTTRSGYNNIQCWASLVVQWLRICLPMQGTWVWFLVRGNSTRCGAHVPQLLVPCSGARELQLLKPEHLEPMLHNKRGHRNERSTHCNED